MAHYLATRMIKLKSQNLGGIQKHNQREFENHSNKDIDPTRLHLNYDLLNEQNINYREKIMKTIEDQKTSDRKIRKDAVLTNEFFVTSSKAFFDELDPDEQKRFFKTSAEWFQERYGEQNIAYATVHNDETTPHMHIGVVPMKDGKLQGKNVFNRAELLHIQENLPKYLEDKGFDVKRGEDRSKNYHVQPEDWKQQQEIARKETLDLRKEKENIASEVSNLSSHAVLLKKEIDTLYGELDVLEEEKMAKKMAIESYPLEFEPVQFPTYGRLKKDGTYAKLSKDRFVTLRKEDFEELNKVNRNAYNIGEDNSRLEKENEKLQEKLSVLEIAQKQLKLTVEKARDQLSKLFDKVGIDQNAESLFNRAMTFSYQFYKGKRYAADDIIEDGQEEMFNNSTGKQDFEEHKTAEEMQQKQIYRGRDDFEM